MDLQLLEKYCKFVNSTTQHHTWGKGGVFHRVDDVLAPTHVLHNNVKILNRNSVNLNWIILEHVQSSDLFNY